MKMTGEMKMVYTPKEHIPIMAVCQDENGIIYVYVKKAGKNVFEPMALDKLLAQIYMLFMDYPPAAA